jgi:hypothetical protein
MVKYPHLTIHIEETENAFEILGSVIDVMTAHGHSKAEIRTYVSEATSGDYEHLLKVTREYVNIEPKRT